MREGTDSGRRGARRLLFHVLDGVGEDLLKRTGPATGDGNCHSCATALSEAEFWKEFVSLGDGR